MKLPRECSSMHHVVVPKKCASVNCIFELVAKILDEDLKTYISLEVIVSGSA